MVLSATLPPAEPLPNYITARTVKMSIVRKNKTADDCTNENDFSLGRSAGLQESTHFANGRTEKITYDSAQQAVPADRREPGA